MTFDEVDRTEFSSKVLIMRIRGLKGDTSILGRPPVALEGQGRVSLQPHREPGPSIQVVALQPLEKRDRTFVILSHPVYSTLL